MLRPEELAQFQKTGGIEWVTDLAGMPEKYGLVTGTSPPA
jgi:hypothetical protein